MRKPHSSPSSLQQQHCIISVTKHWKKDHNKTVTAQSGGDSLKLEAGQRPGTKVWRKTVATINWWNSWRRGSRPGGRSPEQVWRKRNRVESEMSRVSAERHSCTRGRRLVVGAAGHSRSRFMRAPEINLCRWTFWILTVGWRSGVSLRPLNPMTTPKRVFHVGRFCELLACQFSVVNTRTLPIKPGL